MTAITPDLLQPLQSCLTAFRHDLHQHPELGFREQRTAGKIAAALREFGLETHEGVGKTGVVGILRCGSGPAIGLRADMDALPIDETNTFSHASITANAMHACGHDGHSTMLLGAARYLAKTRCFAGTVVFIFQANEEHGLGARAMLEDDFLTRFPVDEVYAIHNLPGVATGTFLTRSGAICCSESLFSIAITAQGGHSSMPHKCVDAILVGSGVVQALQTIASRTLAPGDGSVVSVTDFVTDGLRNVIAGHTLITGDVRARTKDARIQIERSMRQLVDGICQAHGCQAEVSFTTEFVETVNDASATEAAISAATRVSSTVDGNCEPMSFSEDFAWFLQHRPGCLLLLGNGEDGPQGQTLHAAGYDFNDELLTIGAAFWCQLVVQRLSSNTHDQTTK